MVSQWIADETIQAILITGGTGFTSRDSTPEALKPLFDKEVEGFGELFRMVSFEEIGTSTIQSRAVAGFANHTVILLCRVRLAHAAPVGQKSLNSNWMLPIAHVTYAAPNGIGEV